MNSTPFFSSHWFSRVFKSWLPHLSRSSTPPERGGRRSWAYPLAGGLTCLLSTTISTPGWAAERVVLRFGPVRQSVTVADLQQFADTGEVPPSLRAYGPLFNPDTQLALTSSLQLDHNVSTALVDDFLGSSTGVRLLDVLEVIIPESTPAELRDALATATQQSSGLNLISFLRAYPKTTVSIDGVSAIALASQLNLPYWQSQALSSILERELTVPTEPFEAPFDPTEPGYQWVRQQTFTLRDYKRDRSIPVDLYWSRRTQGPLVVISHGFGADRRFLGYLASHLASHGLTVAAIEHPGSNVTWLTDMTLSASRTGSFSDIMPGEEFIDRPQDVSFLLNQLERIGRYSSTLRNKFNTDHVTVIGHSLGGYTALALAGAELDLAGLRQFCSEMGAAGVAPADWLQCTAASLPDQPVNLRDPRVEQIMVLSPVTEHLFSPASLNQISVPILMMTGTKDSIAPAVSQQLLPFEQLRSPKYLLTALGATHLSVGDPANLNQALLQSFFIRERRGEETESIRQLLRGLSLAYIMQMTDEAERYQPFLSSAYVQSFSTGELKLRLNTELPPNLSNWLQLVALPMERLVVQTLPRRRETQQQWQQYTVVQLFTRWPLVMFILPGVLPEVGKCFFKLGDRPSKRR